MISVDKTGARQYIYQTLPVYRLTNLLYLVNYLGYMRWCSYQLPYISFSIAVISPTYMLT